MLMRMYWRRHYGALQHVDAMVCGVTTCNRIWRGQKSFVEGDGQVLCDVCVSSDVFRDETFGCCCKCILGVNAVHCNTLIQWYMVH